MTSHQQVVNKSFGELTLDQASKS